MFNVKRIFMIKLVYRGITTAAFFGLFMLLSCSL